MTNFWATLPKNFSVLAPMEDVTDTVFRQVIIRAGRPDVLFTEFCNVEGVQSVGQARVIHRLKYSEIERPIVAQVWGVTPEDYYKTAKLIVELGFDGMDINMGCPVKKVINLGACSALIKDHNKASQIIEACQKGLAGRIPLSVKTRIGFDKIDTDNWLKFLLTQNLQAITVHGRTVKEQSAVPNHYDQIARAVELRNQYKQIKIDELNSLDEADKIKMIFGWGLTTDLKS